MSWVVILYDLERGGKRHNYSVGPGGTAKVVNKLMHYIQPNVYASLNI